MKDEGHLNPATTPDRGGLRWRPAMRGGWRACGGQKRPHLLQRHLDLRSQDPPTSAMLDTHSVPRGDQEARNQSNRGVASVFTHGRSHWFKSSTAHLAWPVLTIAHRAAQPLPLRGQSSIVGSAFGPALFLVLRDRGWVKPVPGSAGADRCGPVDAAPKRPPRRCTGEGLVDVDVDVDVNVVVADEGIKDARA